MPRTKTRRKFTRRGEFLEVRVLAHGIEVRTGAIDRPVTHKTYRWGVKAARVIAEAVVAGTMPCYAAADWFEDNRHIWYAAKRRNTLREWDYCTRLLREYGTVVGR